MIYKPSLRILWISGGRAVLEDEEGFRVDVLMKDITADDEMISKLSPADAFRLGFEAGMTRA